MIHNKNTKLPYSECNRSDLIIADRCGLACANCGACKCGKCNDRKKDEKRNGEEYGGLAWNNGKLVKAE